MKLKAPTMADIAREAGVTSMTVSRALSKDGVVSEETRKKVRAVADRLGYVLDGTAAGLSSRRSGFVAVVIPTINNSNFAETVQGITDRIASSGLQVLLGYTNYVIEEEERVIETLLIRRPEAIVVTGGAHTPRARRLLGNAGIPVIEMWDIPADPIDQVVGFSNLDAGRLMVERLYGKGYRNIGFIGGATTRDTRGSDRRLGYEQAVRAAGYNEPKVVTYGAPPISMRQGANAINQLLKTWPDVDAVMCVSDLLAFGVLSECQRQGIKVPDELAIAGFGNYDVSECSVPSLTTIDVRARELGTTAADVALGCLAERGAPRSKSLTVTEMSIVEREST
jgi:LacI family gluconate utilization system Gnt-I transcriptional repressor